MKKSLILLMIALGAMTAGAKTVTSSFTVTPGMSCQNCENKIKTNLRFEKGVKKIDTSLADQLVTITYDDAKTSTSNLIGAFKKIGYTAKVSDGKAAKGHDCSGDHKCSGEKKYSGNHDCCSDKKK